MDKLGEIQADIKRRRMLVGMNDDRIQIEDAQLPGHHGKLEQLVT
jgi:hypothetical protein